MWGANFSLLTRSIYEARRVNRAVELALASREQSPRIDGSATRIYSPRVGQVRFARCVRRILLFMAGSSTRKRDLIEGRQAGPRNYKLTPLNWLFDRGRIVRCDQPSNRI
jgi:hypothetical protein